MPNFKRTLGMRREYAQAADGDAACASCASALLKASSLSFRMILVIVGVRRCQISGVKSLKSNKAQSVRTYLYLACTHFAYGNMH